MTTHLIRYEGPTLLAVEAATLLAEASGIDLTGSEPPSRVAGSETRSVLVVTVTGTPEAVGDAARLMRERLPDDVVISVEEVSSG